MLKRYRAPDLPDKEAMRAEVEEMESLLAMQQQRMKEKKLPVLVLVEGWSSAGKGSVINRMFLRLDPRFFRAVSMDNPGEEERRRPFLYRFMKQLPEAGKFVFLDSGWLDDLVTQKLRGELTEQEYDARVESVRRFERGLRDNGCLLIKLFLHIDRDTQGARMQTLLASRDTEWRVTAHDLWQHKRYDDFLAAYDRCIEATDAPYAPWTVVDGSKKRRAEYQVLKRVTQAIGTALEKGLPRAQGASDSVFDLLPMKPLAEVAMGSAVADEEYRRQLKKLQARLGELHNAVYRRRIPVVLVYEGWDAAGKGGNIKRVTGALDPRGYEVIPIASPEPHELARHYLWRFWTRLPKTGHITIFDRSWYGRVMVERIEGFCPEEDWKRAYNEINEFERELTDWGAVVLKFWVHIGKDTQLQRFNDRQADPEKQWKITDEDWRNREKWEQYEEAADEMLRRTSTETAPWIIVESNDKKFARLQALREIIAALENALDRPLL